MDTPRLVPHSLDYRKPSEDEVAVMRVETELLKAAYDYATEHAPNCRERSLFFTKIEEARMWFNAAIVKNGVAQ